MLVSDWFKVYNYSLCVQWEEERGGEHKNKHSEHTTHRLSTDQRPKKADIIIMIQALPKKNPYFFSFILFIFK